MKKTLLLLTGKFRMLFNFCPECNSDAPAIYDCDICKNYLPQNWWNQYKIKNKLNN